MNKHYLPIFAAALLVAPAVSPAYAQNAFGVDQVVQACTTGVDEATCSTEGDRYIASLRAANLSSAEFDARLTDLIVGLATSADTLPVQTCLEVGPPNIRQQALLYNDPALAAQANEIADSICQGGPETGAIAGPFSAA